MNPKENLESIQKISDVVDALQNGSLNIGAAQQAWAKRLLALPRGITGLLDISSLSNHDIAIANSVVIALRSFKQEQQERSRPALFDMKDAQCELFRLFEKLFIGLTGVQSGVIEAEVEVKGQMLTHLRSRGDRFRQEVQPILEELRDFYAQYATLMFRAAKGFGGVKVVIGGQRAFRSSELASTRIAGLYCDTQLIPDPIYPFFASDLWLNAKHLQLAITLLHVLALRPLVDARLNEPPILIFPSFEQGLERNDVVTQAGIASLAVRVVGPACDASLQSGEELREFARSHEKQFLESVFRDRLFVPPGVDPQKILTPQEGVSTYLSSLEGIRDRKILETMKKARPGALILNGLLERLAPQYHLLENADELSAQPMLTQQVHWHYFELCAAAGAKELVNERIISKDSFDVLRAMQDNSLAWLTKIPVEGLVELRRNREHAELREQLKKFTSQLMSAGPAELEGVTREVRHGLEAMIQTQQKAIQGIERKYSTNKWKVVAGAALGGATMAGMSFLPALAVVAGISAPVVAAVGAFGGGALAYTKELVGETVEKNQARKSLLGVLAIAHSDSMRTRQ
jgi:hypothetical protein